MIVVNQIEYQKQIVEKAHSFFYAFRMMGDTAVHVGTFESGVAARNAILKK